MGLFSKESLYPLGGKLGLAALSSVLCILSFPNYDLWMLGWICLVPGILAVRDSTPRQAFFLGLFLGFVAHLGGTNWLIDVLHNFGSLPHWVCVAIFVLLALVQGGVYGVILGLMRWLVVGGRLNLIPAFALALVASEYAYPLLFDSYLATTQHAQPLMMQTADLFGVVGLDILLGLGNGTVAALILAAWSRKPYPWRWAGATAALVALAMVYGVVRMSQVGGQIDQAPSLKLGMVQASVSVEEKRTVPELGWEAHREMSAPMEGRLDLLVWPETAYNMFVHSKDPKVARIRGPLRTPLLFGAPMLDRTPEGKSIIYNSALLVDREGRLAGRYYKNNLLVFGEYLPGEDAFPSLRTLLPKAGKYSPGGTVAPLAFTTAEGVDVRMGMLICYEDTITALTRRVVEGGPNLLVNLTNDAWFGTSPAPAMHLALAAFRAVEHRRSLVRSTNTGVSCLVDPLGRVQGRTKLMEKTNVEVTAPLLESSTVYQAVGDVAGWGSWLILLGLGLVRGVLASRERAQRRVEGREARAKVKVEASRGRKAQGKSRKRR